MKIHTEKTIVYVADCDHCEWITTTETLSGAVTIAYRHQRLYAGTQGHTPDVEPTITFNLERKE